MGELSNSLLKKLINIKQFHQIKALYFKNIYIHSEILSEFILQVKSSLVHFEIHSCTLSFPIQFLQCIPELETFKATNLDSKCINTSIASKKLSILSLQESYFLAIQNINEILPHLKILLLPGNPTLNDNSVDHIDFKKLKSLEKIDLGTNQNLTIKPARISDITVSHFSQLQNLSFMSLSGLQLVTDLSLTACLSNLSKLTYLNLVKNSFRVDT